MTRHFKPRDKRQKVFLVARACAEGRWVEARIWDVSVQGLMLTLSLPVTTGTEIEIARGPILLRGRVVWAGGGRCGVRTEEPVDVEYLIGRTSRPFVGSDRMAASLPTQIFTPRDERAAGLGQVMSRMRVAASRTLIVLTGQIARGRFPSRDPASPA